jgi:hypothetical protein
MSARIANEVGRGRLQEGLAHRQRPGGLNPLTVESSSAVVSSTLTPSASARGREAQGARLQSEISSVRIRPCTRPRNRDSAVPLS